ncbi:MAG: methyltransferase domain-containing protein [Desulfuromonadales bacterium]|nr:methyltransferase domain-containing protein [Desulfuromonadales bacterium]NIR33456.1 methyltransferase domain-containing protein [Desulfuromonadales bacterium]NIS42214.1 methyltransferase domain-containing protein [Desulfuromonadales bacterium]
MKSPSLTRIIPRAHEFVGEVLAPGDLAIDLTAGNGHDTLVLAEAVGPTGQVIAFDIQQAAIERTAERLAAAGIASRRLDGLGLAQAQDRVILLRADHAGLAACLPRQPRAFIANLGYLPGGDQGLATRPETTCAALQTAAESLSAGGRLVVVVYVGHEGAAAEAEAVDDFFASLPPKCWQVLDLRVANRPEAPYLLVAQKGS